MLYQHLPRHSQHAVFVRHLASVSCLFMGPNVVDGKWPKIETKLNHIINVQALSSEAVAYLFIYVYEPERGPTIFIRFFFFYCKNIPQLVQTKLLMYLLLLNQPGFYLFGTTASQAAQAKRWPAKFSLFSFWFVISGGQEAQNSESYNKKTKKAK